MSESILPGVIPPEAWPWPTEDGEAAPGAAPRYIVRIGEQWLMLPEDTIVEVSDEELPPTRVPFTRFWFLGFVNVRGEALPLYDLAGYWSGTRSARQARHLLLVGQGAQRAAIGIDTITTMVLPPDVTFTPHALPGSGTADDMACRALRLGDTTYLEIDLLALLGLLAERACVLTGTPVVPKDHP